MAQVMLRAPLSELCGGRSTPSPARPWARCSSPSSVSTHRSPAGCSTSGTHPPARQRVRERRAGREADAGRRRRPRPRPARDHGRLSDDGAAGRDEEGAVRARRRRRSAFEVTARAFAGRRVEYAMRDPRTAATSRPLRRGSTGRGSGSPTTRPASGSRPKGRCSRGQATPRADLGDRAGRGGRRPLRRWRPRLPCSRATTAASPGR